MIDGPNKLVEDDGVLVHGCLEAVDGGLNVAQKTEQVKWDCASNLINGDVGC